MKYFSTFETLEGEKFPLSLYKYNSLKESWDTIWKGVSVRNNFLFYNLEVLEDYLDNLKSEFN